MIYLQDNLEILAPKPIDEKYGPYSSDTDAINAIHISYRYKGLTVGVINNSGSVIEYWWQNGILDTDLVQKVTGGGAVDLSNYYTMSQVNALLSVKANTVHTHVAADITDLSSAVLSITDSRFDSIDSLINTIQNYTISPTNGLELTTINNKPSSGNIGFGIANNGVTFARFQQISANRLLGNPTGSTANVSEIQLGSGLYFDGSILNTNIFSGNNGLLQNGDQLELGGTLIKHTSINPAGWSFELGTLSIGNNSIAINGSPSLSAALQVFQTTSIPRGIIIYGSSATRPAILRLQSFETNEAFIESAGVLRINAQDATNYVFQLRDNRATLGRIAGPTNNSLTSHSHVLRISNRLDQANNTLELFTGATNDNVKLTFTPNGTGSSIIDFKTTGLQFAVNGINRIFFNDNGIGVGAAASSNFQLSLNSASEVNILFNPNTNTVINTKNNTVFKNFVTGENLFTLLPFGGIEYHFSICGVFTFSGSTYTLTNPYNTTNVVVLLTGQNNRTVTPVVSSITETNIVIGGGMSGELCQFLILRIQPI